MGELFLYNFIDRNNSAIGSNKSIVLYLYLYCFIQSLRGGALNIISTVLDVSHILVTNLTAKRVPASSLFFSNKQKRRLYNICLRNETDPVTDLFSVPAKDNKSVYISVLLPLSTTNLTIIIVTYSIHHGTGI